MCDNAAPASGHGLASTNRENGVSVELLTGIRDRMMPMLRLAANEYEHRTPIGYPIVVDAVENGTIGIEIDPSYALYIVSDGSDLYADLYYRSHRADARSSASREKFSGLPANDRRPLPAAPDDLALRNLIAEIMSRYNAQPGIIHITDS
jgi:hypothetical protein